MTDHPTERDRLIMLEQAVHNELPMLRKSVDEVARNQNSMNELIAQLAEQSKRFPQIDTDLRDVRKEVNQLALRVDRQEQATATLDNDFGKFVNDEFRSFKKEFKTMAENMNRNTWTIGLVRFVITALFGGAISLLVAVLSGGFPL